MSLYAKIKAAQDAKDIEGYLACLHDDFVFVRHQSGTEVTKAEWVPTVTAMMESSSLEFSKQRCLYENSEIMVEHSFMKFPEHCTTFKLLHRPLLSSKWQILIFTSVVCPAIT